MLAFTRGIYLGANWTLAWRVAKILRLFTLTIGMRQNTFVSYTTRVRPGYRALDV